MFPLSTVVELSLGEGEEDYDKRAIAKDRLTKDGLFCGYRMEWSIFGQIGLLSSLIIEFFIQPCLEIGDGETDLLHRITHTDGDRMVGWG